MSKFFSKQKKNTKIDFFPGVSMVELMVIISIIGIMTAVSFGTLNSTKAETRLKNSQRLVASAIKQAQSYALEGKKQGALVPCGYGFRFTDASTYQIFYNPLQVTGSVTNCDQYNGTAANLHSIGTSANAETSALNGGVTASPSVFEIYFTVPHANVYDAIGVDFSTATITFNFSSDSKTITIDDNGNVLENED